MTLANGSEHNSRHWLSSQFLQQNLSRLFNFQSKQEGSAYQCCGSGMFPRIPDRNFFHPGSQIRFFSIPQIGSASKNVSILTQRIVSKLSEIWYRTGCSSRITDFLPIPDPGVKKTPDPQHWNLPAMAGGDLMTWRRVAMRVEVGNMRSEERSSTRTPRRGAESAQATPTAARKWAGCRVARGESSSRIMLFTALLLPTSQLLFLQEQCTQHIR